MPFSALRKAIPPPHTANSLSRLLGSPHYGERWGRWWLDQARYADSNGYSDRRTTADLGLSRLGHQRSQRGHAVGRVHAAAACRRPAADAGESQRVATGFHRNTQINQEGGIDPEQFRIDSVFDRVATTGTVWLGLTIGCAQCHDHKFDPITQQEYYRFFAFFNNQDEPTLKLHVTRR